MFQLLKLAIRVLSNHQNLADKESCRALLLDFISRIKSFAQESENQLDDVIIKHIECILQNDALFEYTYCQFCDNLQTEDILFESAEENRVVELLENTMANNHAVPESFDPIVIVSLIGRIVSFINTIKQR